MHDDNRRLRPTGPMSDPEAARAAEEIITRALRDDQQDPAVPAATRYRDTTPLPAVGPTPPVAQTGRPPMSQTATDISGVMLAGSVASVPVGGATCLVLYTLGHVPTANLLVAGGAPVALLLALAAVLRRLQGARTEHHHHYDGPVVQNHSTTTATTKGLIARTRTRNELNQ